MSYRRFEVFTVVTMKNGVFWDPHNVTSQKTPFFISYGVCFVVVVVVVVVVA
jgi:hypothetical protein